MTLETYRYDPFGNARIYNPAGQEIAESAVGNTFMFTGREYDAESGYYYFRNRYYDPTMGRFTTRDPLGIWGDPMNLGNPYTYCGNNPLKYLDPFGLVGIDIIEERAFVDQNYKENLSPEGYAVYQEMQKAGDMAVIQGVGLMGVSAICPWVGIGIGVGQSIDDVQNTDWSDPWSILGTEMSVGLTALDVYAGIKAGAAKDAAMARARQELDDCIQTVEKNGVPCFVEGTLVSTPDGDKAIEDFEVGDEVYSYDFKTNEKRISKISKTFKHDNVDILEIKIGDESIKCSYEHPFWVIGKGWISAKDLEPGMILLTSDKNEISVDSITILSEKSTVYNIEISVDHNYFVSRQSVLVHNQCRRKPGSLGKFKGTDALRRENGMVSAAAKSAGLSKDQQQILHDYISGEGYSYEQILEIANEIKNKDIY